MEGVLTGGKGFAANGFGSLSGLVQSGDVDRSAASSEIERLYKIGSSSYDNWKSRCGSCLGC